MYQEFFINRSDAKIMGYLWDVEDPEKVVLIIHGIGEHGGFYDRMSKEFNNNNFTVATMDLRGHGCTTGTRGHTAPRASVLGDVDELVRIARKNYKDKPIVLYGHSMGGNIALDYRNSGELKDEIDAYVICSPWLILKRNIVEKLKNPISVVGKLKPEHQLSAGIKRKHLGNPNVISTRLNQQLNHNIITIQTVSDSIRVGGYILSGEWLKKTDNSKEKPMLLMHGSIDQICNVKGSRLLAELEGDNCQYVEWEGYYHELHSGNAEKDGMDPIRHIVEWLKRN